MQFKMDGFLEVDDRTKLTMMEILNERRGEYTSVDLMVEILGISKFKVSKYVQEIVEDLNELDIEIDGSQFSKGDLSAFTLPTEMIRRARVKYIQESKIFLLFNDMLYGSVSLGQFAQKNYVSRSKTYEVRNNLTKLLEDFSITIQDGVFIGEEEQLRKIAFEVYYYYFNGMKIPFPEPVLELKEKLKERLATIIDFDLTLTKKIKIDLFLSILSIRLRRENYLGNRPLVLLEDDELENEAFNQLLTSVLGEDRKDEAVSELDFILLFLVCEECISFQNKFPFNKPNSEIRKVSNILVSEFISKMDFREGIAPEKIERLKKRLKRSLTMLHFKRYYSFYSALTFNVDQQISFFEESYPQFHKMVILFLNNKDLRKLLKLNDLDEISLYYDYMLALISLVPFSYLNETIYICVDFSRGDDYTEYISENIQAFRHLNIVIQQKINSQTQLFVSDFIVENKRIEQIIWKNPPSDDDWAVLGDTIVSVKRGVNS